MGEPAPDTLLGFHGRMGRCHYCGDFGRKSKLTRDHIIPRSKAGRTLPSNLVWACSPCNFAKGSDLPTCRCDHCVLAVLLHIEYIRSFEGNFRRALFSKLEGLDPYYEKVGA